MAGVGYASFVHAYQVKPSLGLRQMNTYSKDPSRLKSSVETRMTTMHSSQPENAYSLDRFWVWIYNPKFYLILI